VAQAPHPPAATSPLKRGEGQQCLRCASFIALLPATSGEKVPQADEGLGPRAKILYEFDASLKAGKDLNNFNSEEVPS